jgi:hypothetical protein
MDATREKETWRNWLRAVRAVIRQQPVEDIPMPPEFTPAPAVRAPEFPENLDWINTGNRKLKLADLRGKIVLLDFWTYG